MTLNDGIAFAEIISSVANWQKYAHRNTQNDAVGGENAGGANYDEHSMVSRCMAITLL